MDLGLRGRTALVCGGTRGIGFATAQGLVREGAFVAICGRDPAAVAAGVAQLGETAHGIVADLSTTAGLEHAAADMHRWRDAVDVLVTNTGGPVTSPALDLPWSAWESASNLLLRSAVEMTRAFVPGMRVRGWGRVIGITSFAVKQPVPSLVLSNSLRAAVTGYYRTLADEVGSQGVTVNTVLPGYTETERLQALATATAARTGASHDEIFDRWRAQTPVGRLGTPDEVAAMILFLASAQAGFVTGQAICVDGGAARGLL